MIAKRLPHTFFGTLLLLTAPALHADDETALEIEPQPLNAALREFAEQTGLQVMYAAEIGEGIESPGTREATSNEDALDQLLASTGLDYRYINERSVTIQHEPQEVEDTNLGKSRPAPKPVLMVQNQALGERKQVSRSWTAGEDDKDEAPQLEEIVVTGSRIRGAQSASPVVTITRRDIDQGGFATVEELVDKMPQNFGAGASLDTFTDSVDNQDNTVGGRVDNRAGGTSVNLRGLGASSTLILLNGRRMSPSGFNARFTNISSIPVTAIERVEILTDGASAIYGSDAIGGVVNFILREDYEGAETRLRYGSDSGGDTSNILFGQSFGKSWDDGNVLFSYEYHDSENLASRDRDFTSTNDLSRFSGTDWRLSGGNPANIIAGGQTFAIPAGQDGTSLTAADFDINTPLNLYNGRSDEDVLPSLERHSAFLHLTQTIGAVEWFAQAQFSTQETERRHNFFLENIDVPDSNAFFVDPTSTGLTTVRVGGYSFEDDLGPNLSFGEIDTHGAVLGVQFDIGENWNGELVGNWSKEEATAGNNWGADGGGLNDAALALALSQSDPNLAFNPFGDGSHTNPAVLESITDQSRRVITQSENQLLGVSLNVDGTVFGLPGGTAQLAAGVEFREESLLAEQFARTSMFAADLSRDVTAVYAELFFPFVGSSNSRPGVQQLELSLAARYEDYSDFGDSTNPKVGLLWSPTQTLNFRGTYGTSYRAPVLFDLDTTASRDSYVPEIPGFVPYGVIVRLGGNPNLRPEEATTWTAGFQWNPGSINGLSLDMTYFNVDFEDRIDFPAANVITGTNDPRFASLVTLNPTPEQIAVIVNDPRWDEDGFGFITPAEDIGTAAAPVGGILDIRKVNLAQSAVTGLELQLSYDIDTELGAFAFGLNGNYLFDFERRLIVADPLVDEVDTFGRPVDFRARGSATWSREGWNVSGFLNYIDGYTDNVSDPARPVDSWTTVDLTVTYGAGDNRGFLSDTRFSLTAQNLFDEDPPFVDTFGGVGYDSTNGNPMGRFMAFQVTKDW